MQTTTLFIAAICNSLQTCFNGLMRDLSYIYHVVGTPRNVTLKVKPVIIKTHVFHYLQTSVTWGFPSTHVSPLQRGCEYSSAITFHAPKTLQRTTQNSVYPAVLCLSAATLRLRYGSQRPDTEC